MMDGIQEVIGYAIASPDKKSAELYVARLRFMRSRFAPPVSLIFDELVAYVAAASGQVKNREHWLGCIERSLYKLECLIK